MCILYSLYFPYKYDEFIDHVLYIMYVLLVSLLVYVYSDDTYERVWYILYTYPCALLHIHMYTPIYCRAQGQYRGPK